MVAVPAGTLRGSVLMPSSGALRTLIWMRPVIRSRNLRLVKSIAWADRESSGGTLRRNWSTATVVAGPFDEAPPVIDRLQRGGNHQERGAQQAAQRCLIVLEVFDFFAFDCEHLVEPTVLLQQPFHVIDQVEIRHLDLLDQPLRHVQPLNCLVVFLRLHVSLALAMISFIVFLDDVEGYAARIAV